MTDKGLVITVFIGLILATAVSGDIIGVFIVGCMVLAALKVIGGK